jgi:hypothetical protein
MPFELPNYLLGSAIIENQGVPRDEARRLGILPALLDMPLAQSLLISTIIGRNNVPPPAPSITPAPPGPVPLVRVVGVIGSDVAEATKELEGNGLAVAVVEVDILNERRQPGVVVDQRPAEGVYIALNSVVTLYVQTDKPTGHIDHLPPAQAAPRTQPSAAVKGGSKAGDSS